VVSASSGTAALVGAILAHAGRATSDRPLAIVPALAFAAPALAAELCGYRVCLVDVQQDDWMLRARHLAGHPALARTGLVLPVSAFGRPVGQAEWLEFQRATGIAVVIDGAASFEAVSASPGTLLGEVPVALSFHATKAFASGEGGCVVVAVEELADAVTRSLNFGFFEDRETRSAAINGKLSEYHAAVGLAELDGWTSKHDALLEVAGRYQQMMAAAGLADRLITAPIVASCYVLFQATTPGELAAVREGLQNQRIGCRSWYGSGLHTHRHFDDALRERLPVTDTLAPRLLGLPVAPDLSAAIIAHVVASLESAVRTDR
jgi:dTDP-4-amino-4,6-dideoxygalactose transaminase